MKTDVHKNTTAKLRCHKLQYFGHCGCYFSASILTEINLTAGDKCYVTSVTSGPVNAVFHKNKGSGSKYQNENEFHFNSPAVKTDVNRIFLMVK